MSFEIPTLTSVASYKRLAPVAVIIVAVAILLFGVVASGRGLDLSFLKFDLGDKQGEQLGSAPNFNALDATSSGNADTKIDYDQQRNVASFADKIAGVNAIISQQPMPDKFKANPQQEIQNLAKGFNANKMITAQGVKAFYGEAENGSLVVLFTKNNLLIFIRAQKDIDKDALADYIVKLK